MVHANQTPEDAELADILDALDQPDAVTMAQITAEADTPRTGFERALGGRVTDLGTWLQDRRNARQVPHRMEGAGYMRVDNPGSKDGVWKVDGKRTVIYAKKELAHGAQIAAAKASSRGCRRNESAKPGSGQSRRQGRVPNEPKPNASAPRRHQSTMPMPPWVMKIITRYRITPGRRTEGEFPTYWVL